MNRLIYNGNAHNNVTRRLEAKGVNSESRTRYNVQYFLPDSLFCHVDSSTAVSQLKNPKIKNAYVRMSGDLEFIFRGYEGEYCTASRTKKSGLFEHPYLDEKSTYEHATNIVFFGILR